MRRILIVMASAVLGCWLSAVAAADVSPVGAVDLTDLCRRLASADFSTRAAAQKQLDQIPRDQLAVLQQLSSAQADPEVKARLEARSAAIEIDLAIHPPPISLHLDNASPAQTAAALAETLHIDPQLLQVSRDAGAYTSTAGPFTVHVDQAPFWTVIAKLNEGHTLAFSGGSPFHGSVTKGADFITEPFCVHPHISRGPPDPQGLTPVQIQLMATVDPRLNVAQCQFEFTDIRGTDDHNLLLAPVVPQPSLMRQNSRFVWSDGMRITLAPQDKGIRKLKAVLHVMVVVKEERLAIDDVAAQLNKPIATAQGPLTFTALTETPSTVSFVVSTPRQLTPENEATMVPITVQLLTDTGTPLVSTAVRQSSGSEIPLVGKPKSYRA